MLSEALSKIHVIPDGWTSPNKKGLLGVNIQWVHKKGLQTLRLSLTEFEGKHSGLVTAQKIIALCNDYGFLDKLGFVVADNASPMDTTTEELEKLLGEKPLEMDYDQTFNRLRCFGHIVNLTVSAFFFGPTATEASQQTQHAKKFPDQAEVLNRFTEEDWREHGCLGKLHNIITYIHYSPQRMARFKLLSGGLSPKRDNKTRWNSWYEAIEWALREDIMTAIDRFCKEEEKLYPDELLGPEWKLLANVAEFLKPFFYATKATESVDGTIEKVLPLMDRLLKHLEDSVKVTYKKNEFMKLRANDAWEKLRDYYALTDDTIAYFAATALNPRIKMEHFKSKWTTANLKKCLEHNKKRAQEHWETCYKNATDSESDNETVPQEPLKDFWDDFTPVVKSPKTEWAAYFAESLFPKPKDPNWHPVDWWMEESQKSRFPTLYKVSPLPE